MNFWPFNKKQRAKGLLDIIGSIPSSITFRRDAATQSKALEILSSPTGHLMLSILRNESPMRTGSLPGDASAERMARAYGVQEGYELALERLSALAEPAPDNTPIPETFTDEFQD